MERKFVKHDSSKTIDLSSKNLADNFVEKKRSKIRKKNEKSGWLFYFSKAYKFAQDVKIIIKN